MILKVYLGRSDGQISGPIAGLIVGVVILFVGLFAISVVSDVVPGLTENAPLTTVSNSTAIAAGGTGNDTYFMTVGTIVDSTADYITVTISNTTDGQNNISVGALTVNVSLNKVNIANIALPNVTTDSVTNITTITLVPSALNNISFGNENLQANETRIVSALLVYAETTENTRMGNISDGLITTTGTIFSVLGLVIIVVALSMAIQSLRRETV